MPHYARNFFKARTEIRLYFRAGIFVFFTLVFICVVCYSSISTLFFSDGGRQLQHHSGCVEPADPVVLCLPYAIGVAYLLLALAIVADEFFVPALDVLSDWMELTPDVAGATLLAAGGSAPELFTALVGTFNFSDVGFGTIVSQESLI